MQDSSQQSGTQAPAARAARIGAVAIGRNEGERLRACLKSLAAAGLRTVYVDSASSDGSVEMARRMGVEVVELDMSRPLSAARARNDGFARLHQLMPDLEFVQFVDGDCALLDGWVETALEFLEREKRAAVVCGRRRERDPEASIYNRLCDMEWNSLIGEARASGGDSIMRVRAFVQAGGFDPAIMSGEEPELCFRMRRAGWKIHRLDCDMTLHDAAIFKFSQWWRRMMRGGYGLGQLTRTASVQGTEAEEFNRQRIVSAALWGIILPLALVGTLLAAPFVHDAILATLVIAAFMSLLIFRSWAHRRARGDSSTASMLYAVFIPPLKVAHCFGLWHYMLDERKKGPTLIEYKDLNVAGSAANDAALDSLARGALSQVEADD